ncbi:MAG: hypothetical protein ACE5GY_10745 [Thermodesulfobacteriota bacterium]
MIPTDPHDEDNLSAAKGILYGLVISALIGILVLMTIHQITRTPAGAGKEIARTEVTP